MFGPGGQANALMISPWPSAGARSQPCCSPRAWRSPRAEERQDTAQTGSGRKLEPVGRMTELGAFPTGGAVSPDGRFYWAVDAGRGANYVRIVHLDSGLVRQTLPLPGGYVGIAFAPDGRRAYVSGLRSDGQAPPGAKATGGDAIHVYGVDASGEATELDPIALPNARDGAAANDELPPASNVAAWPEGLDVTEDGRHLVVALGQADQAAIIDLRSGEATLADVGRYPYGVVTDPRRPRAYVTNERDGTVSVIELPSGRTVDTIPVGGPRGSAYAHAQGIAADPQRDRVYVAVTDRDLVAVVDTDRLRVARYVDVGRPGLPLGVAPVSPSVAPNGDTLYVANAGEDAVVAIALEDRPATTAGGRPSPAVRPRTVRQIGRYRRARARALRARGRAGDTARAPPPLRPARQVAAAAPADRAQDPELRRARRAPGPPLGQAGAEGTRKA